MVIKAPHDTNKIDRTIKSIFLAGSIEMGTAVDWQDAITKIYQLRFNIFNPRRDSWDSSWEQSFNNPEFYQQVNWELSALDKADYIIMYFDPESKSPISLLELGLYASSGKLHVICPEGFYRKGNVDIVCNKYNIPIYKDLKTFNNQFLNIIC